VLSHGLPGTVPLSRCLGDGTVGHSPPTGSTPSACHRSPPRCRAAAVPLWGTRLEWTELVEALRSFESRWGGVARLAGWSLVAPRRGGQPRPTRSSTAQGRDELDPFGAVAPKRRRVLDARPAGTSSGMRRRPSPLPPSTIPMTMPIFSAAPAAIYWIWLRATTAPLVRIRGREARHCFALAREFLAAVAWDRAFNCRATIMRDDDPRTFGRHLTVVRGALTISGGLVEPRVYDGGL
jgi:hypothetical protein